MEDELCNVLIKIKGIDNTIDNINDIEKSLEVKYKNKSYFTFNLYSDFNIGDIIPFTFKTTHWGNIDFNSINANKIIDDNGNIFIELDLTKPLSSFPFSTEGSRGIYSLYSKNATDNFTITYTKSNGEIVEIVDFCFEYGIEPKQELVLSFYEGKPYQLAFDLREFSKNIGVYIKNVNEFLDFKYEIRQQMGDVNVILPDFNCKTDKHHTSTADAHNISGVYKVNYCEKNNFNILLIKHCDRTQTLPLCKLTCSIKQNYNNGQRKNNY